MILTQDSKRYFAGLVSSNLKVKDLSIPHISYGIPVASFMPSIYAYIRTRGMLTKNTNVYVVKN